MFLSLAVLATISTQAFGMRALATDPIRQQASEVAIEALTQAELTLAQDFTNEVTQEPTPHATHTEYTVEISETIENPTIDTLKKVVVTVTWEGRKGREQYELWTVFIDENAIAP